MGKTFMLKNTRLYINQYDLSGLSRSFDSLLKTWERVDMTGWDQAVSRAIGNRLEVGIEGYSALLDVDTGKSADALIANQDANVSLLMGATKAPIVGDLAYLCPGVQLDGKIGDLSGAVGFTGVNFYPEPNNTGQYFINPYGVVLEIATERTETKTGDSVLAPIDEATETGWSAILHIISSGDEYTITIEHSANDDSWAELTEFTANGATAISEHKSGSTSVNKYVRYVATKTSGNLTAVCVFARNNDWPT